MSRQLMIPAADTRLHAVDDIGRVIDATGIERPILVGWSHGATIAVRYAAQHPGRVGGLVLIDGAYPIAVLEESGKQKVRTQFRRLGSDHAHPGSARPLGPDVSRRAVFATTPHSHTQILNKAPDTVVAAIEDVIHESS